MPDFSDALRGYTAGQEINSRLQTPAQAFLESLRAKRQMDIAQQQAQGMLDFRKGELSNQQVRNLISQAHWEGMKEAAQQRADAYSRDVDSKVDTRKTALDIKQAYLELAQAKTPAEIDQIVAKTGLTQQELADLPGLDAAKRQYLLSGGQSKLAPPPKPVGPADVISYMKNRNADIAKQNAQGALQSGYKPSPLLKYSDAAQELAQNGVSVPAAPAIPKVAPKVVAPPVIAPPQPPVIAPQGGPASTDPKANIPPPPWAGEM